MILYVNGCSHSAAAEAAGPWGWASDDSKYWAHDNRGPHPKNLAVSYGQCVATGLNTKLICQASSGGSNDRTIRITQDWIKNNPDQLADIFMILQWTTWEREEWFHKDAWYQVNASGVDSVPPELVARYKEYIVNIDWEIKTKQAHDKIWAMHQYLESLNIPHLFFSGQSTFSDIPLSDQKDWGVSYIHPYSREHSYHNWLINNGGTYSNAKSYHFDAKSHRLWADYVLQYINDNNLIVPNEISTD